MIDDDPYRSSVLHGTCPRCGNTVDGDLDGLACPNGCGEFVARERLAGVWHDIARAAHRAVAWPQWPAQCPQCRRDMTVAYRDELRFDRCGAHGVWLDAGERARFDELFGGRAAAPAPAPPFVAAHEALLRRLELAAGNDASALAVARAIRDLPSVVTVVRLDGTVLTIEVAADRLELDGWHDAPEVVRVLRERCRKARFEV